MTLLPTRCYASPVNTPNALILRLRAALALCALLFIGACAHEPQQRRDSAWHAAFAAADDNGDEQLDAAELRAGFAAYKDDFAAIDTDGNGLISEAELRSYITWQQVLRRAPGRDLQAP